MAIKVLIVEDESAIADNLQALLQAKGYEASCALDGPEGVDAARKFNPDLILLDIMLPRLNGFEVCRILKADAATKNIRVVMVTGLGRTGDVELAFAAGADDYLIKPYDTDRLFKKIQKVLSGPGPA
jgi:two-component system alkaline phosphatase synthesis response regulator PhoP